MKIAILAHLHHPIVEPFLGGTEMHTSMVANELTRRGHEVTLFAKQGSRSEARVEPVLASSFRYGDSPGSGAGSDNDVVDRAALSAIQRIRGGGFDVVLNNSLGHLPYSHLFESPMLTVLHTPATLERVTEVVQTPGWRPGPRHAFVSVSEYNAVGWRALLPRVETVWNGIYQQEWAGRHAVAADRAVWAARITPEKGLHVAIEAAQRARIRLAICGPVSDRSYFRREIEPQLGKSCVYRGHLHHEALGSLLGGSAVFLASALWPEPFGLSMVEAMASGTPVAALPAGAAREIVGTEGGSVARDGSVSALVDAIGEARHRDRDRVRRWADRFDGHRMIDRYEARLAGLAGQALGPNSFHVAGSSPAAATTLIASPTRNGTTPSVRALIKETSATNMSHGTPTA